MKRQFWIAILLMGSLSACGARPPVEKIPVQSDRVICQAIAFDGVPVEANSLPPLKAGSKVKVTGKMTPAAGLEFQPTGRIESVSQAKMTKLKGKRVSFHGAIVLLASRGNEGEPWKYENGVPIHVPQRGQEGTFEFEMTVPMHTGQYEFRIWADNYDPWSDQVPPRANHDLVWAGLVRVEK